MNMAYLFPADFGLCKDLIDNDAPNQANFAERAEIESATNRFQKP